MRGARLRGAFWLVADILGDAIDAKGSQPFSLFIFVVIASKTNSTESRTPRRHKMTEFRPVENCEEGTNLVTLTHLRLGLDRPESPPGEKNPVYLKKYKTQNLEIKIHKVHKVTGNTRAVT